MITVLLMMSFISFMMRFAPFCFATQIKRVRALDSISQLLPPALIWLLVIYCLLTGPCSLAEWLGVISTTMIHIFMRNVLVSLIVGVSTHQLVTYLL